VSDSPPAFRIEPLGEHDRAAFSCGVEALDRYLREQASQDARRHAAAPFVLVTAENRIAGYYTLSANVIRGDDLPAETVKKLKWPPYGELPATLIGRLARDIGFRGQGIGELLLMDALKRAFENVEVVGALAVVVDAKDEEAGRFYAKYGFLSFPDTRERLYLPMKTVEKLFASSAEFVGRSKSFFPSKGGGSAS
jgi:ribosomal protein S18 acetylase RimI-like enzyme